MKTDWFPSKEMKQVLGKKECKGYFPFYVFLYILNHMNMHILAIEYDI